MTPRNAIENYQQYFGSHLEVRYDNYEGHTTSTH